MSYQLKILKDHPILYYPISETYTSLIGSYQDVLNTYDTYQEFEDDFSTYSDVISNVIFDHSGCENHGIYQGDLTDVFLPLTSGGSHAANITNTNYMTVPLTYDYYGSTASGGLGTKYTSDNDFTIESWIYTRISTTNIATIFADPTNNVGLFWQRGNLIFKLNAEVLNYTVPNFRKSLHVVAVYSVTGMSIYVDGQLAASKSLSNFEFTNTSLNLQIGTTGNASDSFIVDDPAVYRYALSSSQILNHYNDNGFLNPIQIAYPDGGQIFEFYDNGINRKFRYSYPSNKSWDYFLTSDLYYDGLENSIAIAYSDSAVSKTVYLTDLVSILLGITMDSSKIEWEGDNGIMVETSVDNSTWVQCINGESIPQYKLGSFNSSGLVYIKITMSTTDNSKYLPKLYNLTLSFYNDQIIYAQNAGSYMSTFDGLAGISNPAISLGPNKYPILSRDFRNGIRVTADAGFYINANIPVKTIEFFYTPDDLTNSGLVNSTATNGYAASNYSWNNAGAISKTNVNSIYVNGVNKTSATAVSDVFTADDLHHVVITYTNAISGAIRFSYSLIGTVKSLIQNLGLYETQFTGGEILNHYDLYISKASVTADDSTITLTENSVQAYNNEWLVIQNV
jgi:hypothetical protein